MSFWRAAPACVPTSAAPCHSDERRTHVILTSAPRKNPTPTPFSALAVPTMTAAPGLRPALVGGVVGRVAESMTPAFNVGDVVEGPLGWQDYALSDGRNLREVDTTMGPLSKALGALGNARA